MVVSGFDSPTTTSINNKKTIDMKKLLYGILAFISICLAGNESEMIGYNFLGVCLLGVVVFLINNDEEFKKEFEKKEEQDHEDKKNG